MRLTPAFVFDLDGTLIDTAPDLRTTINAILARDGRRSIGEAEIRSIVGRGARNLIVQAFARTGAPVDAARLEGLYDEFLKDYGSHIADASRPFPGVVETLAGLKAEGARLGVLTNKPHASTLILMRALGMEGYFDSVCGQGKRPWLKPDPRLFADVVGELGGPGAGAIMVGDSIADVETARGARVPVILMSYGYTPEPAASLGADLVLDDFRQVPEAARQLLGLG
jgi:phosphoglycolate phosphatase